MAEDLRREVVPGLWEWRVDPSLTDEGWVTEFGWTGLWVPRRKGIQQGGTETPETTVEVESGGT